MDKDAELWRLDRCIFGICVFGRYRADELTMYARSIVLVTFLCIPLWWYRD